MKSIKKILAIALSMLLIISAVPFSAFADEGTNVEIVASGYCGADVSWELDGEGTLTISGTGEMYDFEDETDTPWYQYISEIYLVEIQDGVTSIGDYAFYTFYDSVIVPNSVVSIKANSFDYGYPTLICSPGSYAAEYAMNNGVRHNYVFNNVAHEGNNWQIVDNGILLINGTINSTDEWNQYASDIRNVYITGDYCEIEKGSFCNFENLETVFVEGYIYYIEENCFCNCPKLTIRCFKGSNIDTYARENNIPIFYFHRNVIAQGTCGEKLNWILDGDNILYIEGTGEMYDFEDETDTPWYQYISEIYHVEIQDGVTSIGDYAFYTFYESIIVPNTIIVPDSVVSIKENSFNYGYPTIICSIGSYAAEYAMNYGLEYYYVLNNIVHEGYGWQLDDEGTLIINSSTIKPTDEWNQYASDIRNVYITDDWCKIEKGSFCDFENLATVSIEAYVYSIEENCFCNCPKLTIRCNKGGNIDDYAKENHIPVSYFFGIVCASGSCGENLTWKYGYSGMMVIEGTGEMYDWDISFDVPWYDYMSEITSVKISDGVTSVGDYAFYNCTELENVEFSDDITTIGDYAFGFCSKLGCAVISDNVTAIGDNAFEDCSAFAIYCNRDSYADQYAKDNNIPTVYFGLEPIASGSCGENVSWELDGEGTLTIKGTGEIRFNDYDDVWFEYADSIYNVQILNGVTSIPGGAFYSRGFDGLVNLESVTIPNSVTYIERDAFKESCFWSLEYYNGERLPLIYCNKGSYAERFCETSDTYVDYYTKLPKLFSCPIGSNVLASGTLSDNIKWSVNSDRTLYITGTGDMPEVSEENQPWNYYNGFIRTVKIGDGITTISDNAFTKLEYIEVVLSDTVTELNVDALPLGMFSLTLGKNTTKITSKWLTDEELVNTSQKIPGIELLPSLCVCLSNFTVAEGNPVFCDIDGVLYTADKTEILLFPVMKFDGEWPDLKHIDTYVLPDTVTSIGNCAFLAENINNIIIPYGVKSIGTDNFYYTGIDPTQRYSITIPETVESVGDGCFLYHDNLTIYCYEGSYVDNYAKGRGITVSYLEPRPKADVFVFKLNDENIYYANQDVKFSAGVPATLSADGKTLVPLRAIAGAVGIADLKYDAATSEITFTDCKGNTVTLTIGSSTFTISNGSDVQTFGITAPVVMNYTTMLPLREVAALVGGTVKYESGYIVVSKGSIADADIAGYISTYDAK